MTKTNKSDASRRMASVGELVPYDRNARTHSEAQIAQIAASIREFGFVNPILVDEDKRILAGHGRLAAALSLGMAEVPVLTISGLSDVKKRAYTLADNKIAENADWDLDLVAGEFLELSGSIDLTVTGWSAEEITKLLDGPEFLPSSEEAQSTLDGKSPTKCPSCGHEWVE